MRRDPVYRCAARDDEMVSVLFDTMIQYSILLYIMGASLITEHDASQGVRSTMMLLIMLRCTTSATSKTDGGVVASRRSASIRVYY